jgi:hypothetical protein
MDQIVGFDSEPNPRVWKVYSRRLAKGMKDSDVAKVRKG